MARHQEVPTVELPIGQFLGSLCHCIKIYLGEEHMHSLREVGFWNAFIHNPIPTKEMWDGVQSAHPTTLS